MNATALLQKLRKARTELADLGEGKKLSFLRPPEAEFGTLSRGVTVELIVKYSTGWEGFVEHDLLRNGNQDPVEFHAEVWAEMLADRADWITNVANAMVEACTRRFELRKDALGN